MKKIRLFLVVIFVIAVVLTFVGCQGEVYLTSSDGDFKYELITVDEGQAVRIVQYIGSDADVTIPATIDTYPVAELADGLFIKTISRDESRRKADVYTENTQVKTVTILADIKELPPRAFYYCTELTSVILPESITKIGAFAFYGCTKLKNITLPAAVDEIEGYAFRECAALEEVTILSTVRPVIGDKVFYMLDSKKSGNNQYYIIENLTISVADISLFSKADIEEEFKTQKITEYLNWVEYINAGKLAQVVED